MREPHMPGSMPPRDWGEAFAALPPETPPADALSGVFARLPTSSPTRPRRQWWIAAAAVLALAAVIPMAMNVVRHSGASRSPAVAIQKPELDPGLRRDDDVENVGVRPNVATPAVATAQQTPDDQTQDPLKSDSRFRGNDGGKNSTPTRIAKADRPHRGKPHRSRKPVPTADPPDSAMEPLYAESARLEALLALARDDRAASATAVALGSDFEARVAGIDAALAQPALTKQRRLDLWRERVSALRAYASFESTQRALAAQGERYDAMLVSID
jgi:hypothetical protein